MSDQKIRELQLQVVSMRSELPKMYGKLMKKEYHLFIKQFKTAECIIPDQLENFQHWNEHKLEKHRATVLEIPLQDAPNSVTDIIQRANAIRRAREMLDQQLLN